MSTLRDTLYAKVKSFYQKHDPERLKKPIDPIVNYALAEGIENINKILMKKYGASIILESEAEILQNDREGLRHKIELFYLKHDPSKLDKADNVESILEWALLYGVAKLNEKLKAKYQEDLFQATEKDAIKAIERYYQRQGLVKTEKDHLALVEWASHHSFIALNTRLITKYGKGLGELDRERKKEEIKEKLETFYKAHDAKQLEDEKNIRYIIEWTLKHGIEKLNQKLQAKYGANFNTIPVKKKSEKEVKKKSENEAEPRKSAARRKSAQRKAITSIVVNREVTPKAKEEVEKDERRMEDLKVFANFFFAKYDQERLYNGGVSLVLRLLTLKGEEELNESLKSKYGEGLDDIERQYKDLEERLLLFFKLFDEDKLDHPIDSFIGWAILHGEDKLNAKLMNKYDEDLRGSGLKQRLTMFYQKMGEAKTPKELDEIATWTMKHGHAKLDRRLKKKYGKCLEDMFITAGVLEDEENDVISTNNTRSNSFTTFGSKNEPGNRDSRASSFPDAANHTTQEMISNYKTPKGKDRFDDHRMSSTTEVPITPENKLATKDTMKTLVVEDVKTMRQKSNEVEAERIKNNFKDELEPEDYRAGNRKSLKMLRNKRRPSVTATPNANMYSKLTRFLNHVDNFHAEDVEKQKAAENSPKTKTLRKNASGSFSFKMEKNGAVQENLRLTELSQQKTAKLSKKKPQDTKETESQLGRKTEADEKTAATNLVNRLRKFYERHDARKATQGKIIRLDVEYVLQNGIDAFNRKLLKQYGESLNSVGLTERRESKKMMQLPKQPARRRKKLKAVRSKKNFEEVAPSQAEELNEMM